MNEKRVGGRTFELTKDKVSEGWKKGIMKSFIICISHQISLSSKIKGANGGWVRYVLCMDEIRKTSQFYSEYLKKRDHWRDKDIDWSLIVKCILQKYSLKI
jgi:hypothetical protein